MKRIHLFEFEDQSWFPGAIRNGLTRLIQVLSRMMGTSRVLAELILKIREKHPFDQLVDLGSGAGGVMPDVIKAVREQNPENPVDALLTDLHPEPEYIEFIEKLDDPNLDYHPYPVDATQLDQTPDGLKTMFNSFHHLPPAKAKNLLHSAADSKQPLLIYEMTENKIPILIWLLFLPISMVIMIIMVIFMTPFVRPLTWKQLLFTYLIPLIPLAYAWDGQVSSVRTYTFEDLGILLKGIKEEGYVWKLDPVRNPKGRKMGYFLLGLPEN